MAVNDGTLGSSVSLSQIQAFYGGSNPISLSEYYRGGGDVPNTAVSGNNPYTGQTSATGSGTGNGGTSGISVDVTDRSTTSGGGTSRISYGGNPGNNNNRPGFSAIFNFGSRGDNLYILRPDASTVFGRVRVSGGGSYSYQVSQGSASTSATGGDFRGAAWTPADGNSSLPQLSATGTMFVGWRGGGVSFQEAYLDQRAPLMTTERRQFVFTNNTGQNISLSITAMGGNAMSATLARGGTIDTGILNGSSEAWTFSYSYQDAGSGMGSGDETNDGVVTDVTSTTGPPMTVVGNLTTSTPSNSRSFTVTDWQSVSYVRVTQGGRGNHNISGHGTSYYQQQQDDLPTSTLIVAGPVWRSGDGGTTRPFTPVPTSATTVGFSGFTNAEIGRRTVTTIPGTTTHDITFMNNTGSDIILSTSSTGASGATRTITNGATAQVANDASNSDWEFQYRYAPASQPANTALPTSGTINMDQFNAPGNAAP